LTTPEQMAFANRDIGHRAVCSGETDAKRELPGRLLLDGDVDDRLVGGAAGIVGHVDFLEEAEVTDALLRPPHLRGVERVALYQAEFSTDDSIQRSNVAGDIDSLDVNARSLLHLVDDIDRAVFGVPCHFRLYVYEGEASITQRVCQLVDAALD